jgi:hypothetical protein
MKVSSKNIKLVEEAKPKINNNVKIINHILNNQVKPLNGNVQAKKNIQKLEALKTQETIRNSKNTTKEAEKNIGGVLKVIAEEKIKNKILNPDMKIIYNQHSYANILNRKEISEKERIKFASEIKSRARVSVKQNTKTVLTRAQIIKEVSSFQSKVVPKEYYLHGIKQKITGDKKYSGFKAINITKENALMNSKKDENTCLTDIQKYADVNAARIFGWGI